MALISSSIPNLINGVSQQPPSLRLRSQAEEQINGLSSVVKGLLKRPPTKHVATIASESLENSYVHPLNRGDGEKYVLVIEQDRTIRVFDTESGYEYTVENNDPQYLSQGDTLNVTATTVADYTFILNRDVVATQASALSPTRPHEALVFVKTGEYKCDYSIIINGSTVATYRTPSNTSTQTGTAGQTEVQNNQEAIRTNNIAEQLRSNFSASGFTCERIGSTLYIKRSNNADFDFRIEDSQGGKSLFGFKGSAQKLTELPRDTKIGFVIKIVGDVSKGQDDYYVTYDGEVWKEVLEPNVPVRLEATSMPHQLVRSQDAQYVTDENPLGIFFDYDVVTWDDRKVGTENSNPFPSFIDQKISDIFFHRNRLGMLSGESVVFSQSGEFFNYFRATTLALLDTAPIDVAVSNNKVSNLERAVPFNETLLLFSKQTQFALKATDILTPESVQIDVTTQFECELEATPVGAGKNVYFAVNRGVYSGVREFFVSADTETNDAADITGHVPEYIQGKITQMAASSNEEIMLVRSSEDPSIVYVYNWYWQGAEKAQQAWSKWTFDGNVLSISFDESDVLLIIERDGKTYLEKINLSLDSEAVPLLGFDVHLDRRFKITDADGVPYDEADNLVAVTSAGVVVEDLSQLRSLAFDWAFVGVPYEFRYVFSEQVITESQESGARVAIASARLQLRNFNVSFTNSGYFKAQVTPKARSTYEYLYNGRTVGSPENQLDVYSVDSGYFKFPIMAKSDGVHVEIKSDDFRPAEFQSVEWEAFYHLRSSRF